MSTPIRSRASIIAFALPVALTVSACFGSSTPAPTATPQQTASPTEAPTAAPTAAPTSAPTAVPTTAPTAEPTGSPEASGSPTASGSPGAVDVSACTGTAQNLDFFSAAATGLKWPVYCAVLPTGWKITGGNYQGANGGQVVVAYKNAAGATFSLSEGNFCTTGVSACSPRDTTIGDASFGDLTGTLVTLTPGFAIYVAPGTTKAYQVTGTGMDQATFTSLAAALHKIVVP